MPSSAEVGTLVLTRGDVQHLLGMAQCIAAVERAFRLHADGQSITPGVLGTHVEGGGFHVKTAGITGHGVGSRSVYAAKVNANFPGNPALRALPTIQGVLALFDASTGQVLAVLDSIEITSVRTAAATAVAARHLARPDARSVTVCGCGEQGRSQLRALACVRQLHEVWAFDIDPARAGVYAREMSRELGIPVAAVSEPGHQTRASDIWVTCTPSRRWFLGRAHVGAGAFVAAVGADNPDKQEIEPALLAGSTVVADLVDQCASIGDLHHALIDGAMQREDVHADLAQVVSGRKPGRRSPEEVIVFDSTGTALEDVAAAVLVYERAMATGTGTMIDLARVATHPLGGAPAIAS